MQLRIGGRTSLTPTSIAPLPAPSTMQTNALVAAWDPLPGTATFKN